MQRHGLGPTTSPYRWSVARQAALSVGPHPRPVLGLEVSLLSKGCLSTEGSASHPPLASTPILGTEPVATPSSPVMPSCQHSEEARFGLRLSGYPSQIPQHS